MRTVDADSPQAAVQAALQVGMVPQDRIYKWARVVTEVVDGMPTKALRFEILPDSILPVDWQPPDQAGL
jgi:hypothetical protein